MSAPRGPYAKTSAKREQILRAALEIYAEAGSRKVSVRDIAKRVGMTDTGVLHHFGSREALLTAVLEARDKISAEMYGSALTDPPAGAKMLADNVSTPGLVKLFLDVAAAAAEPEHPAHDFFTERYARFRREGAAVLADPGLTPDPGTDAGQIDSEWAARILIAALDGLQIQWLLEPDIDMAADLAALHRTLLAALRR
ncbi:TetR/AcrR family transcriptional regulator [Nonomuraea endophytica]|uniref:AcrR family transcriptional regulator n=1 Tax=Nonomuraea endophytica TaxID=714136 RepID=A0A7W8EJU4_9ACTN|nr:TetR/AcrR family transcriptional regulator [Nonomuraea endophytica]MBB5083545.1 AcrR family transcriptional regulator [Nonomuraea endophytica]